MHLQLIDHGRDLRKIGDVDETVRHEVGDADGADFAGLVRLLHGAVSAVIIIEWLVDQHKVHIVGAQLFQRCIDRSLRLLIAAVADPDLGGQKQPVARYAAIGDGSTYAFLVKISLRGIDAPVANGDRLQHAAFGILRRDLKNAVAQHRNFDAVS